MKLVPLASKVVHPFDLSVISVFSITNSLNINKRSLCSVTRSDVFVK